MKIRALASLCRKYLSYYNDFTYDFHKNGEANLLGRLAPLRFETIVDVGANVGEWAQIAAGFFPSARIHCFELSNATFTNLSARLQSDPGNSSTPYVLNNLGLSDREGSVTYKDYGTNSGVNTILLEADFHDRNIAPNLTEGKLTTGDAYCQREAIARIDFLKIDVEGAEHLVLKGLHEMLTRKAVRVIQIEYGYVNGDSKFLMRDFYKLFEGYGYLVGKVKPGAIVFPAWTYKNNDFNSGPNYVAVRKDDVELLTALSRDA